MAYNPKAIANYFIDLAKQDDAALTPMKLQKLIYFAHGWHLAIKGEPLINQPIEAWQYGPVIPSVYHEFKDLGRNSIDRYATDLSVREGLTFSLYTPRIAEEDSFSKDLLDEIYKAYGQYGAIQLSNLTHTKDSPWDQVWSEGVPMGKDIDDGIIREYFRSLAKKNRERNHGQHQAQEQGQAAEQV